jgi:hypothetical protein
VTDLTELTTQGGKAESAIGLAIRPVMLNSAQFALGLTKEKRGILMHIRGVTPTRTELEKTLEEVEGRATLLIFQLTGFDVAIRLIRCN